jgi:predicted TIM-barrel fold metal-dependent hydrolase
MYLHPERPSKLSILAARDRLLERHPKLRVVGCHLGSMEEDVDDIAKRFDRYPNFSVDTAARVIYLMLQPREKVRAFLIRYQDRVLYGTDLELLPWEKPEETLKHWEAEYARDWKFFATDESLVYQARTIRGLALPEPVLRKLYHDNALRWVPGVVGSK